MQTADKKVIRSWTFYDWGNSAYNLVITSTIFPAYFEAVSGDGKEETLNDTVTLWGRTFVNTSLYNYALAIAFVVVALTAPLLSSIADYRGNKKQFLFFFCTLGSLACSALYFFDSSNLAYGLACAVVACIGFWSSLVFYNSFLPDIAAPEDRDNISARGYSMGYIGSMILQIICFVFVLMPDKFGITTGKASQISFLLVGIWWWGFGQLALRGLPNKAGTGKGQSQGVLLKGYQELQKVWHQLQSLPTLKRYLGAYFFYNMGVQTVMLVATLYGKSELHIPTTNLIISILLIQLIAIPGAFAMSKLSAHWGNLPALQVIVLFWVGLCVIGYLIPANNVNAFYGLAVLVGFVMGGIQSLSRSTYAKLMPETPDTTSFFSFYDVTEKISIVIGMVSFGLISELSGSQRNSVLVLTVFFVLGFAGLYLTRQVAQKTKHETA